MVTQNTVTDCKSAIATVKNFLPAIAAKAADTEKQRRIPDETIADLQDSGLFDVVKPKIFGGSEAGFEALVRVTVEIGTACGSSAWVYGVIAGHSWLLNLFPEKVQREVFENPKALLATVFRLNGTIKPVEGGYHLTNGEGGFCSGVDFADWVIIGGGVQHEGAPPEPRFFVVPMSEVEVVDDWQVIGMKGTGSKTIRIKEAFIPAHRTCSLDDMLNGTSPGAAFHNKPLYRRSFATVAPFSIVGAPIGVAKGGLNYYVETMRSRLANADPALQSLHSTALARYANADAQVDAAIELVSKDAANLDRAYNEDITLTPLEGTRVSRNWSFGVQSARDAFNSVYAASGGSQLYDSSVLQRYWRDVNSGAQHIGFSWDTAMPKYGRLAAGIETEDFLKKFIAPGKS